MKATELRLGNLIKIGGNTLETYQTFNPAKVTLAILNEIVGENAERPDAELSVFQPIPLTEEWLLKFGFTERPLDEITMFKYKKMNVVIGTHTVVYNGAFMRFCFYVHQLQNLYFALTGEELITQ